MIGDLFRAMNTKVEDRAFFRQFGAPRFSRIARSYLLRIGNLDWTKINSDIFGLMIQAVADDDERGGSACTTRPAQSKLCYRTTRAELAAVCETRTQLSCQKHAGPHWRSGDRSSLTPNYGLIWSCYSAATLAPAQALKRGMRRQVRNSFP